jgi:hypothetical protein
MGYFSGGAAAWTPASLSGLKLWLDASVSGSITLSGSDVTQWDDQSGNGNNVVQATSARRPTYSATGFNGSKPGITCVAANSQFLRNTSIGFNSSTGYIFVVQTNSDSNPSNGGIICFVGSSATNDFGFDQSFILAVNGSSPVKYRMTSNAYDDAQQTSTLNTPQVIGWIFNGASTTGYLDFSADTAGTKSGALGNTTADIALGSRPWNGNTPSFDGVFAEIVLGEGVPSAGDLTSFHSYCQAKWGTS